MHCNLFSLPGPLRILSIVILGLLAPALHAATISTKANPNGQTLFLEQQFDLQCWLEGVKIIDEKKLNTMTLASQLNDQLLSFKQGDQGEKTLVMLTIGDALCMAKSSTKKSGIKKPSTK